MWLYTFRSPRRHKKEPSNAELLVKGRLGGFKRQWAEARQQGIKGRRKGGKLCWNALKCDREASKGDE